MDTEIKIGKPVIMVSEDSELVKKIIADEIMREFDEWKLTLSDEMKQKYFGQDGRLFMEHYTKIGRT